jgi:hypothetical protein
MPDALHATRKSVSEACAPAKFMFHIVLPISSAIFNPPNCLFSFLDKHPCLHSAAMNPNELNAVDIQVIRGELGDDGWKNIEQLTKFLFAPQVPLKKRHAAHWENELAKAGRFAPSIVTRIEVGVFGTSMPRFCYRLNFQKTPGFINVRRLRTLEKQLREHPDNWWSKRDPNLKENEKHPRIKEEIQSEDPPNLLPEGVGAFVIADCLFTTPARFPLEKYHVITASLFKESGEILNWYDENDVLLGTPYVKTVSFSGGLCAQATCFVATALLGRHAHGVYGLSEITALASSPELKELLIAGLSESEMAIYFENIGLMAIPQFTNPNVIAQYGKQGQDTAFKQALHGYVSSGMPVILSVDMDRMDSAVAMQDVASIYKSNGYNLDHPVSEERRRHSVIVVGCSRWENSLQDPMSSKSEFLLLDPSALPFMKATVQQLAVVGMWGAANPHPDMQHPAMLPATPGRVKMPLLCFRESNAGRWKPGLIELSRRYPIMQINPNEREFILATLDRLPFIRCSRHFGADFWDDVATILHITLPMEIEREFGLNKDHWVWLECGADIIKIWNAMITPEDLNPATYLQAAIQIRDQRVVAHIFSATEEIIVSVPPDDSHDSGREITPEIQPNASTAETTTAIDLKNQATLKVSLLSSFSALGAKKSAGYWESIFPNMNFAEAYICMQNDVNHLLGGSGSSRAVYVLAEQAAKCEKLGVFSGNCSNWFPTFWKYLTGHVTPKAFARQLSDIFRQQKIVAFTTYIPEIMARQECAFKQAQDALKYVVETAGHLKTRENLDSPFTIVIVGGSRLHGMWKAKTTDGDSYAVNRIEELLAMETLLQRLEPVAKCAASNNIQLALELEPGPLFILDPLGDKRPRIGDPLLKLRQLCSLIESSKYPYVCKVVGVNLDIAHLAFLGKVNLAQLNLKENGALKRRIIHAHISDQYMGHFCDNAVGTCHSLEEFRDWLRFLEDLNRESQPASADRPCYSGFVSCEMEACKDGLFVSASLNKIQSILADLSV